MGLIRFVQDHNRNKHLEQMTYLKQQEVQQQQVRLNDVVCPNCNVRFPYPGRANYCPNCGVRFQY